MTGSEWAMDGSCPLTHIVHLLERDITHVDGAADHGKSTHLAIDGVPPHSEKHAADNEHKTAHEADDGIRFGINRANREVLCQARNHEVGVVHGQEATAQHCESGKIGEVTVRHVELEERRGRGVESEE